MKALVEGVFLSAEKRPWEFEGKTGETWSISILQDEDSTRLPGKADKLKESDFPERMTPVVCEVDFFRDGSTRQYKPSVVAIRSAADARQKVAT